MPRVSKAQAAHNREATVKAAAQLFRERGVDRVSVQDIMATVGLTHGGFYRQFDSKEALLLEAVRHAYTTMATSIADTERSLGSHEEAQRAYVRDYLSAPHRDHAGQGCPTAGLVQDIARSGTPETREELVAGVRALAAWLDRPGGDGLVTACTMIGALLVARASSGTPFSDEVLTQVTAALTAP